ncbi:MAG: GNAT family N-acetyltransferase [Methanobrevibacter sp.]|uniref:GNAT family N-acetyltransferase n=1 Tax=Methanobrevibacter sp. TaxID=66852 RepID=UPI0025DF16B8|nr:GNAT family N-acetyltransferase [Methanobrevibacter sp.]MBQ8016978.1 GNAT family N-acetyltransferase [Methanobrevibacter sp.]
MKIEYIKNNYKFETLTEEHDLTMFECDSEDLNDFLKNDALKQQNEKLNLTKLITCEGEIIGFVSLLTDSMKLKLLRDEVEKEKIKGKLNVSENNPIPAIKIGRFAIDKKYTKHGLGSQILRNILYNLQEIAEKNVGLRFVVVEGYATAYNFYVTNNKFKNLKKDEKNLNKIEIIKKKDPTRTFYLYYDLKDLDLDF